ncbi:MAG: hypothetical protein KDC49_16150 [Saprospiraceae bacterium]|nr:hypothetical protein [Saprospiraceae bacterium]
MKTKNNFFFIQIFLIVFIYLSCTGIQKPKGKNEISNNNEFSNERDSLNGVRRFSDSAIVSKEEDSIYESIKLINGLKQNLVDEYNVGGQILEFRNPESRELIKAVDLIEENPFHKMGFTRRIEPGSPNLFYFLMKENAKNKFDLSSFLPKNKFQDIPNDFPFDRALAEVDVRETINKYVAVCYQLNWMPDAYSDNGEWFGPGYCINYIIVYDSFGNEIFNQQDDGHNEGFSVSENGKYLFTLSCLSTEWDSVVNYLFKVTDMTKGITVYEEIISDCKLFGGAGSFYYDANSKLNVTTIRKKDNATKNYIYYENQFYVQKEFQVVNVWYILPDKSLKVYYNNQPEAIIDLLTFFNLIKIGHND